MDTWIVNMLLLMSSINFEALFEIIIAKYLVIYVALLSMILFLN